jgi:hypothetical protein
LGGDFDGAEDEVFQGGDEGGGIADGGHHAETRDARFFGVGAAVDIDFVKGFDVFGDERDGNDHGFLHAFVAEFFERAEEGRLKPFRGADLALVAEKVRFGPVRKARGALFADEANGFGNVLGIRVALFDEAHGQPVSAEEKMNARSVGKLAKAFADVGDQRFDVEGMIVESFDGAFGKRVERLAIDAAPLFQAAERGGVGIVRIEREKNEFVEAAGPLQGGDGVFGERFPVAHGGDGNGIDIRRDGLDEADALAFGEDGNGGAAADHGVTSGNRRSALFGDVARERAANEIEGAERDDVGVVEEVAEEGFDVGEGVGAAELEEDDADAFLGGGHSSLYGEKTVASGEWRVKREKLTQRHGGAEKKDHFLRG